MSADGSAPMQFLDAIDPLTDAEVATNSASFVDFLVTRCSGKPAADAEALATDLGARGEDGAVEGRAQDHGLDPTPAGRDAVVHVREDRVTDGRAEVGGWVAERFER